MEIIWCSIVYHTFCELVCGLFFPYFWYDLWLLYMWIAVKLHGVSLRKIFQVFSWNWSKTGNEWSSYATSHWIFYLFDFCFVCCNICVRETLFVKYPTPMSSLHRLNLVKSYIIWLMSLHSLELLLSAIFLQVLFRKLPMKKFLHFCSHIYSLLFRAELTVHFSEIFEVFCFSFKTPKSFFVESQ